MQNPFPGGTGNRRNARHEPFLMTSERFLYLLTRLQVWSRAGERAPHKPLLLLLAMGNLCRGEPRLLPYRDTWRFSPGG